MRISTGVLTYDPVGKCWKNEPVEVTDEELNIIENEYWLYREQVSNNTAMLFADYLKAVLSLTGEGAKK